MKQFLQIFLVLALIAGAFIFNIGLIDVRYEEVDYILNRKSAIKNASETVGLIARFELLKNRIESKDGSGEDYELEAMAQALSSSRVVNSKSTLSRKLYLVPVRFFLNLIRIVLGKDLVKPDKESKLLEVIDVGYFWERNRKYNEALKVYTNVISTATLDKNIKSSIFLHIAFCYSMLNKYNDAVAMYEHVISNYPQTDAAIVSWKLLDFIKNIQKQRKILANSNQSLFDKAKSYYRLMDYYDAIKNFALYLEHSTSSRSSEARFYKGRSHEELGQNEDAVYEYRKIIKSGKSKKWSKEANRRMLMLGEFYTTRRKLADEARKQLDEYHDKAFGDSMKKLRGLVNENSLKEELVAKEHLGAGGTSDEVTALLNNLGDLDLTGEKERERALREYEKNSGRNSDKLPSITEIKRKKALSSNPFRRPSVIKEVIDGNVNQLKYIYNKQLRRGKSISGRVIVEMSIHASGSVSNSKIVSTTIGDSEFEQALCRKIDTWHFRAVPDSLGTMKIKYPFEFYDKE